VKAVIDPRVRGGVVSRCQQQQRLCLPFDGFPPSLKYKASSCERGPTFARDNWERIPLAALKCIDMPYHHGAYEPNTLLGHQTTTSVGISNKSSREQQSPPHRPAAKVEWGPFQQSGVCVLCWKAAGTIRDFWHGHVSAGIDGARLYIMGHF
jgi:hypothetical protein